MAMASIIINTIQITQGIFSHLSKSFDLTVNNWIRPSPITFAANEHKEKISTHRQANVVKIFKDAAENQTGRLALTGRMSDVCAELERMAAGEALHQPTQTTLWH